jgi:diaminopimelate epimerase
MRFSKYHGAGNDFVMVTDLDAQLGPVTTLPPDLVSALCDRHTGVGADGLIRVVAQEGEASYYMDYYNADGGPAEMCGNGIRCLVIHELREGRIAEGVHKIATGAGIVTTRTVGTRRVTASMGTPRIEGRHTADVAGEEVPGFKVDMGNPHFIVFLSEYGRALDDDETVLGVGSRLEVHRDFPNRTNVEFVQIVDATRIRMRVWERGVGETMACGSGACAAAVASAALERTGPHLIVEVPGGELEVEWEAGGDVWLTGPAEEVFTGEIDRDWLEVRGLGRFAPLVETL